MLGQVAVPLEPAVGARNRSLPTHATWVVAGVALLVLSLVALGLPGTLVLAGGWLLAAAIGRLVPGLDGPVSWAAAVVVEICLIAALSAALAVVSAREHGSLPNLVILAFPGLLGAVGLALSLRRRPLPGERSGSRPLVAGTVVAAGLLVPLWIASHGLDFRVAWATSGDARNHVLIVRQILEAGGLTTSELRGYPAIVDALTALLSGAGGRHGLAPGQLMLHDAHAMAATYVVCGIALATMIVAALLELLPPAMAAARRLPAAVVVLVLAASSLSVTALVLGTSLRDGYLSSYGTLPAGVAAIVIALRCCGSPSPAAYLLLGPSVLPVFFGWTLLAAAPTALVLVAGVVILVRSRLGRAGDGVQPARPRAHRLAWPVAAVVSAGSALAVAAVTASHTELLHQQFKSGGSITTPQPRILWLLGFLAVGLLAAVPSSRLRRQLLVPVCVAVVGGATVRFLIWLSPDGKSWGYYSVKCLYMFSASLVWLLFVPPLLALTVRPAAQPGRLAEVRRTVAAAGASLAILVVVGWSTTVPSPLQEASTGWSQPTAGVLTETARWADRGQPFLLWHWTDPGNERLGNFWAALTWGYGPKEIPHEYGPTLPGGIAYWAYVEGGGLHDLCNAAKGINGLNVVTHDAKLKSAMAAQCPNLGQHVVLER